MKLPKQIQIGAVMYSLIERYLEGGLFGVSYQDIASILIAPNLEPDRRSETVLHEITHAMSFEFDLDLSEEQVNRLSTVMRQSMKSNPRLWEAIVAGTV